MATILPLRSKYYGTKVELTANGEEHEITVWVPDHFARPFASEREMAAGYDTEEGSHDHVEDVQSLRIAQIIAKALTEAGY